MKVQFNPPNKVTVRLLKDYYCCEFCPSLKAGAEVTGELWSQVFVAVVDGSHVELPYGSYEKIVENLPTRYAKSTFKDFVNGTNEISKV